MKIRHGFVTNSSSSSFILKCNTEHPYTKENVLQFMKNKLNDMKGALIEIQKYMRECHDNNTPTAIHYVHAEVSGWDDSTVETNNHPITYEWGNRTNKDEEYIDLIDKYDLRYVSLDELEESNLTDGTWSYVIIDLRDNFNNHNLEELWAIDSIADWYEEKSYLCIRDIDLDTNRFDLINQLENVPKRIACSHCNYSDETCPYKEIFLRYEKMKQINPEEAKSEKFFDEKLYPILVEKCTDKLTTLGEILIYFDEGRKPPQYILDSLEEIAVKGCQHMG